MTARVWEDLQEMVWLARMWMNVRNHRATPTRLAQMISAHFVVNVWQASLEMVSCVRTSMNVKQACTAAMTTRHVPTLRVAIRVYVMAGLPAMEQNVTTLMNALNCPVCVMETLCVLTPRDHMNVCVVLGIQAMASPAVTLTSVLQVVIPVITMQIASTQTGCTCACVVLATLAMAPHARMRMSVWMECMTAVRTLSVWTLTGPSRVFVIEGSLETEVFAKVSMSNNTASHLVRATIRLPTFTQWWNTFLTSYKLFLAKRSSEKLQIQQEKWVVMSSQKWILIFLVGFVTSLKIALRETICKKLKSVPPLCVTSFECRALFRVENLALAASHFLVVMIYFKFCCCRRLHLH